jgi:hypothetical protein
MLAGIICDTLGLTATSGERCPVEEGASALLGVMIRVRNRNDRDRYFNSTIKLPDIFNKMDFDSQVDIFYGLLQRSLQINKERIVTSVAEKSRMRRERSSSSSSSSTFTDKPLSRMNSSKIRQFLREQLSPEEMKRLIRLAEEAAAEEEGGEEAQTGKRRDPPRRASNNNTYNRQQKRGRGGGEA